MSEKRPVSWFVSATWQNILGQKRGILVEQWRKPIALMLKDGESRAWASSSAHLLPGLSCASDIGFEEEIMTFKRISQAL